MTNQIPLYFEEVTYFWGKHEWEPVEDVMPTYNRILNYWYEKFNYINRIEILDFLIEKTTFLESF